MSVQEVTKFKNGKLALRVAARTGWYLDSNKQLTDSYYHDIMFMSDLYIFQLGDSQYLVDYNTQRVYLLGSYLLQNPVKYLLDGVMEANKNRKAYYLYPLSKKECKQILRDLELEYGEE